MWGEDRDPRDGCRSHRLSGPTLSDRARVKGRVNVGGIVRAETNEESVVLSLVLSLDRELRVEERGSGGPVSAGTGAEVSRRVSKFVRAAPRTVHPRSLHMGRLVSPSRR